MWVIRSQTWESTANYITRLTNIYQTFWQIVVVCQVGNIHYRNWDLCKSILQGLPVRFLGECAEQSISFLGVRSWHPFSCFKCNLRWKISCRLVFLSGFIHCAIKERWIIRRALHSHGCCWHTEGWCDLEGIGRMCWRLIDPVGEERIVRGVEEPCITSRVKQ